VSRNPRHCISEADLSATVVGIDDFSVGFVQTYIVEHFATDVPTREQIEEALRALEEYHGYNGLRGRARIPDRPSTLPSATATQRALSRRADTE
jgi:hypothetical protein